MPSRRRTATATAKSRHWEDPNRERRSLSTLSQKGRNGCVRESDVTEEEPFLCCRRWKPWLPPSLLYSLESLQLELVTGGGKRLYQPLRFDTEPVFITLTVVFYWNCQNCCCECNRSWCCCRRPGCIGIIAAVKGCNSALLQFAKTTNIPILLEKRSPNAVQEKGFNFDDTRIMRGAWRNESNLDICKIDKVVYPLGFDEESSYASLL
ncbi:Phospholipid-transporting ATPase [Arachis hypogaea]|nr:Phospholipid-transporting ATPase [Arachis hypogaea]